jgi:hypothetical protein
VTKIHFADEADTDKRYEVTPKQNPAPPQKGEHLAKPGVECGFRRCVERYIWVLVLGLVGAVFSSTTTCLLLLKSLLNKSCLSDI